jgi:DNA repair exonuclease SbcCD nuclease subunit
VLTRLVHIGDFHAAPGPRTADRYGALDQIIAHGLVLSTMGQLGGWLWPGDLFDALSTIEDRNAIDERLVVMAEHGPVVICDGNHDRPGDLAGFARLTGKFPILVISRPQTVRIQLATGEHASIFVLPYPQKAVLVGAGVAPGDVVSTAADVLEPIFMQAAAELEAARAAGDLTLMIGHVNVAGAIASTGQPNVGREIELNPNHLDRLGNIPKLLNHIHKPQTIAGAHYAGSVCRMDYGEIEEKRFLVASFYDEDTDIDSFPLVVPPMFHVDGMLSRTGFTVDSFDETNDAEIHRRLAAHDWKGGDVRCRYRYRASEKSVLDEQTVRDLFAGALRLKVEGVSVPDRELRAPEVAAAKTLPEKLAAMRKQDALPVSIAEKLAWLERADADRLLVDVADRIKAIEQGEEERVAA